MSDLTPEQQAALDAYWAAKSPLEQQTAYGRMMALGLPDSYGVNAWGTMIDGVDYTPERIRALVAENKLLRGQELIARSDEEIVGLVYVRDRLICATKKGVFERREDGKFHEIEFVVGSDPATTDDVTLFEIGSAPNPFHEGIAAADRHLHPLVAHVMGLDKREPTPDMEHEEGIDGCQCKDCREQRAFELNPTPKLFWPGPIANAIFAAIIRWQGKHYGVAPPSWAISEADYEALRAESRDRAGGTEVGEIKIAGAIVHPLLGVETNYRDHSEIPRLKPVQSDPAVTITNMGQGYKPEDMPPIPPPSKLQEELSKVTRDYLARHGSADSLANATVSYEGSGHVEFGADDLPLSERGFGTDKSE